MGDGTENVAVEEVDMSAIEVFHFKEGCKNFEDYGRENGFRHWYATDFAKCLEYGDYGSFVKAVNRAIAACAALNIPIEENFTPFAREVNGKQVRDFKLSRFACYLTAMNGDAKKQRVAEAQAYFAVMAESFRQCLEDAENIERLNIREEITGREKSLSRTAKGAGVENYAYFQNAGYRGMYNMSLGMLKIRKGMPVNGKSLLDYMGKQELAANLFRITQTEAKISNEKISGQTPCERAAESVGRTVRKTMIDISGTAPEHLRLKQDIRESRKNLKQTEKGFKSIGKSGKKKLPPST